MLNIAYKMGQLRAKLAPGIPKDPLPKEHLSTAINTLTLPIPEQTIDKLDRILDAIEHTREQVETKIGEVLVGLGLLHEDHKKLAERVTQSEYTLRDLQPKTTGTQSQFLKLIERVRYLEGRAKDA